MSGQLIHIFDQSACLSKRQIKDYVTGNLSREESYALEHHANNCFFCNEALDGMMANKGEALAAIENLDTSFLKERFSITHPQVHLNSIAPAASAPAMHRRQNTKSRSFSLKPSAIAAGVLLSFGVLWYLQFGEDMQQRQMRKKTTVSSQNNKLPENSTIPTVSISDIENKSAPVVEIEGAFPEVVNTSATPVTFVGNEQIQSAPASAIVDTKTAAEKKNTDIKKEQTIKASDNVASANKEQEKNTANKTSKEIELPIAPPRDVFSVAAAGHLAKKDENTKASGADSKPKSEPANEKPANTSNSKAETEQSEKEESEDKFDSANALFESGNYSAALSAYKKQMSSGDRRTRQHASLMAARCYINIGQQTSAVNLLQALASDGSGPQKRQAKRMLKDLGKEIME